MADNDLTRVTVLLLTYEDGQRQTAARTLCALHEHLQYEGPLHLHIADDGSVPGHVDRLREIAGAVPMWDTIGTTNAERGGYGKSYNLATQAVHAADRSGVVLPLEDDWELSRDLVLDPLVATLMGHHGEYNGEHIQSIRLGYLGFTQRLAGSLVHSPGGPMLLLDPKSAEPHVFAGHPRLETVTFERTVGPWPEGLPAGQTEFDVAHRAEARRGIAWPLDIGPASQRASSLFIHIGGHGLGEIAPGG